MLVHLQTRTLLGKELKEKTRKVLQIAEQENLDVDSKFLALVAIGSLMLDGLVKRIALDFDVDKIAKAAKSSKDAKVSEAGADIEMLVKQP
ncbi:unnamed protein product [Linum trigynum]|uniref:PUL domain-containing protein n=1 Tax=Linum trigynum TaxID=586398 RepID=A0AAV2EGY7_9ROSI